MSPWRQPQQPTYPPCLPGRLWIRQRDQPGSALGRGEEARQQRIVGPRPGAPRSECHRPDARDNPGIPPRRPPGPASGAAGGGSWAPGPTPVAGPPGSLAAAPARVALPAGLHRSAGRRCGRWIPATPAHTQVPPPLQQRQQPGPPLGVQARPVPCLKPGGHGDGGIPARPAGGGGRGGNATQGAARETPTARATQHQTAAQVSRAASIRGHHSCPARPGCLTPSPILAQRGGPQAYGPHQRRIGSQALASRRDAPQSRPPRPSWEEGTVPMLLAHLEHRLALQSPLPLTLALVRQGRPGRC